MTDKKQVIVCEHCGNKTPHEIIFTTNGPDEIVEMYAGHESAISTYYFLTRCSSCLEVSLFGDWEESDDLGSLKSAILMYPKITKIHSAVPAPIVKDYNEAKKVIKKSPHAFAVLVRRAMENVCIHQDAKGKDLKEKIDDLAKREIIPKSLARMANAIRYIGNIGAHVNEHDIDQEEALILDDFMRAILEYVYVAPAKLDTLAKKISK